MTARHREQVCKESVQCVQARMFAHARTNSHAPPDPREGGALLHTKYSSTSSATGAGRPLRCMHNKKSTRSRRRTFTRFKARSNVSQSLSNSFVVLTRLRFAFGCAPSTVLKTASAKHLPDLSTSRMQATPCRYRALLQRTPLPTLMLGQS